LSLSVPRQGVQKDTETELARNGIVRLALPLPYKPGVVNIYLLKGRQPALIDTGLHESVSRTRLWEALSREGIQPDDIEHIFLTHGHADHAGAAAYMARNYGTTVWVHALEKPRFNGQHADFVTKMVPELYRRLGADQEALDNAAETIQSSADTYLHMHVDNIQFLEHGQKLPVEGYDLHVLFTPGHSPGSVCFLEKNQKIIFTGDTLLSEGVPRPTLNLDEQGGPFFNVLTELKKSIASIIEVKADLALPGHVPPASLSDLISKANKALEKKEGLVLKKCSTDFTPYDLIRKRDKRLKSAYLLIDLYQTRAILEVLRTEGAVKMRVRNGVEHFSVM